MVARRRLRCRLQAGRGDVQRVLKQPDTCRVTDLGNGVRIFDL